MDGWVRKFYVSSALRPWIHLTKRAGNQTKTIMNRRFGYVQLAAVILPVHRSSFIYMMFTKHLLKTSFGSLTYFGFCRLGILFYCNQVTPCTLDDFTDQYFLAALKILSTDPDNRNVDYYSVVLCIPDYVEKKQTALRRLAGAY